MNNNQDPLAQSSNPLIKYLLWVFWNMLGFTLALPAAILTLIALGSIMRFIIPLSPGTPMEGLVSSLSTILQVVIIGLIIALCQGIGLGIRKIQLPLWLLANTLTWTTFLALTINSPSELFSSNMWIGTILRGIGMGTLLGIPQGYLMKSVNRRSWWWVLASILGGIIGFGVAVPIAVAILRTLGENPGIAIFSVIPLFGFVSSFISGLFLLRPIRWFDSIKAA